MKNSKRKMTNPGEKRGRKASTSTPRRGSDMKYLLSLLNSTLRGSPQIRRPRPRSIHCRRPFKPAGLSKGFGVRRFGSALALVISAVATFALLKPLTSHAVTAGKVFARPEDAVAELRMAASNVDTQRLHELFGPAAEDLQNPDRVQATNDLATFSAALSQSNRLDRTSATNMTLEVGDDLWPFPIPLVKDRSGWYFDTGAGKQELLNRRIGRNELDVLSSMRAYVDAQREYASQDHTGNGVLKYAQQIRSSPGKTDGLYWPIDLNGQESPLGPLVADAQEEGYFGKQQAQNAGRQPFHGYYFKILTRQGKHAPGGKYDYVINGNMIGGFAMVAWPASYGETGIMTFIVNQQGRVYQKDLGSHTFSIAEKMKEYDPDSSWSASPQ